MEFVLGLIGLWLALCAVGTTVYVVANSPRLLRTIASGVIESVRREPDPWGRERRREFRRLHEMQRSLQSQRDEDRRAISRIRRERPSGYYRGWWAEALRQHGWACVYCGVILGKPGGPDFIRLHKEHDVPLARGGPHAVWNIVPACADCNFRKGTLTGEEFRSRMLEPAYLRRRSHDRGARARRVAELDRVVLRAITASLGPTGSRDTTRKEIRASIQRYRAAGSTTASPSYSDLTSSLIRLTKAGLVERTVVGRYRAISPDLRAH